jgi:hypothetical protein
VTLAAEQFGWAKQLPPGHGKGFAFARYKNLAAYCALAVEVEIEPSTGYARVARAVSAVDSGEIVNLDGIRNQIEGGILQSLSWTMYESVDFDQGGIRSTDWSSYPILRFSAVPDAVEVHVVARPGQPFLGTGEASQGLQLPQSATPSQLPPVIVSEICRSLVTRFVRRTRREMLQTLGREARQARKAAAVAEARS